MSWTREEVRTLINEYKRHPCLYMVKTKQYMNKHARTVALSGIVGVLKRLKPDITVNDVKTKFQGLKATFLTEYKKHKDSMGTGKGEDEIYYTTLWYFEDFMFIVDHVQPRNSFDSLSYIDSQESQAQGVQEEPLQETQDSCSDDAEFESNESQFELQIFNVDPESGVLDNVNSSDSSRPSSSMFVHNDKEKQTQKKRKKNEDNKVILREASNALQKISAQMSGIPQNNTPANNNTDDAALAQFIITTLQQINKAAVRLEVEENILNILYSGIKRCRE